MANILVATPERSDVATLSTPGTVAGSLPLENVLTQQLTEPCRFTSLTDTAIVFDLLTTPAVNIVWASLPNGTDAATWRVRAANDSGDLTSAPDYDSGDLNFFGLDGWHWPLFLESPQSLRFWRIDFSDPLNPDGFLDVGRAIIAEGWQPTINIAYRWPLQWLDPSARRLSLGGQLHTTRRPKRRALRVDLMFQDEDSVHGAIFALQQSRGTTEAALIVRDPASTTYRGRQCIYGLMGDPQPMVNSAVDIYDTALPIEELIP